MIVRRLLPALAAALIPLALLNAAETAPPVAPVEAPPAAAADAAATKARDAAAKAFAQAPQVRLDGAALRWAPAGAEGFVITGLAEGRDALVTTAIGPVRVARDLVLRADAAPLSALPGLVAQAQKAGLASAEDAPLIFGDSPLTGLRLRSKDSKTLVVAQGVMTSQPLPADRRPQAREAVRNAAQAMAKALPGTGIGDAARRTVEHLLAQIDQPDLADEDDRVSPQLARRIVLADWLGQHFPKLPAAADLQQAVRQSLRPHPELLLTGEKLRLARLTDAFGGSCWLLTAPDRTVVGVPPPPTYYLGDGGANARCLVVSRLPAGADPVTDPAQLDRADEIALYHRETRLARWTAAGGLEADAGEWRKVYKERGGENITGALPPHLVVRDPAGGIRRLITAAGALQPPRNGTPAEAERFLTDAARVLPDAAHLDLLGNYLFKYVYDSPDPRLPFLVGNDKNRGDIHQTAEQSVATAAGGVMRGDCDDLSELYHAVLTRQGRTPHVISLPQHAAVAWAEKNGEGWQVFVLQTGPGLEFTDAKLQGALEKAYRRFDASDTFDPNGLGLLLRFSGENTRSAWRLSWRIFAEPDYAKTMIDVQRDWHYQTYLQGIQKVEKLIAGGDQDTANYRELAGLFNFTGQYAKAADYLRQAIERTPEPQSKLFESNELVLHLLEAGKTKEAHALVQEVLTKQLPPLEKELGPQLVQFGLQLAEPLTRGESYQLASQVLGQTTLKFLKAQNLVDGISAALRSGRLAADRWNQMPHRMWLWRTAAITTDILRHSRRDDLVGNPFLRDEVRIVQDCFDDILFHDDDETRIYALIGSFYAALLGRESLLDRLDQAAEPKAAGADHADRVGGLAQLDLDLPWIKVSVPFWQQQLEALFAKEEETLDKALVARLAKGLQAAVAASRRLEIDAPLVDNGELIGRLIAAVVGEDEAGVRAVLKTVKERNDKRLRDDAAEWLGNPARFTSPAWFAKLLQCWREEVDYKDKYFWISWRAALNRAPAHALMAADVAAKRFPEDPTFAAEAAFMKELLNTAVGSKPPPAAPPAAPTKPTTTPAPVAPSK